MTKALGAEAHSRQAGLLALPNRHIQRVDPYPGAAVAVVRVYQQVVRINLVDACMQEAQCEAVAGCAAGRTLQVNA